MSISTTIPIQIRVDKKTREEATALFEELGTSMSGAVNMFLKQCVMTDSIPLKIQKPRFSEELINAIEDAEHMDEANGVEIYDNFEDYQSKMRKMVDDE